MAETYSGRKRIRKTFGTIGEVADVLGIGFEAAASRLRRAYQQFVKAYDAIDRRQ